jgi:hypothetical protein
VAALADTIPGYAEALARERELRELAFCGACAPIAGVEVVPLTLRRLALLRLAHNPFVAGSGPIRAADAALFLWVVSSVFKPADTAARDAFVKRIAALPTRDVQAGIYEYLHLAFFDLDAGSNQTSAPIASFEASVVHTLAKEYGWTRDAILDLSLAEISQYLRLIDASRGSPVVNPTSDGVKMKWLESVNNRTAA